MSKSKNLNIYPKKIPYKILKIRRVWHRVLNKGNYLSYRPLPTGFQTSDTVINSCIARYAPIRSDIGRYMVVSPIPLRSQIPRFKTLVLAMALYLPKQWKWKLSKIERQKTTKQNPRRANQRTRNLLTALECQRWTSQWQSLCSYWQYQPKKCRISWCCCALRSWADEFHSTASQDLQAFVGNHKALPDSRPLQSLHTHQMLYNCQKGGEGRGVGRGKYLKRKQLVPEKFTFSRNWKWVWREKVHTLSLKLLFQEFHCTVEEKKQRKKNLE